MFRNYIKVAFRTLFRNKLFSTINIFGLALSMSVCLLVLLRLKDQVGYDKFHPDADRTYRIITDLRNNEGQEFHFASTPLPFQDNFAKNYGFIESAARLYMPATVEAEAGKKVLDIRTIFSETSFFSIFGFTLKDGDPRTALASPNSIVLSAGMSQRLFGNEDALGKTISFKDWGPFKVTGVLDVPKGKSHIDYEAFLSFSSVPLLEKTGKLPLTLESWNQFNNSYTYIKTNKGINEKQLQLGLARFSDNLMKQSKLNGKERLAFRAQGLNDIILGEELWNGIGNTGSKGKVWAEVAIAFVILLSACFNYTNLSISRSFHRGKEIGVRKVSGAFRIHIFWQFIIESLLVSLLALAMAYVILRVLIDYMPFAQELVPPDYSLDMTLLVWFLGFAVFTSFIAGAIPAWSLSSFKPVLILKNLSTIRLFGGNIFRKGLIVTQFTLSLVIIIFTQTFNKQFEYMEKADPGYARKDRLYFTVHNSDIGLLSTELERLNGVESVTAASSSLGRDASGFTKVRREREAQPLSIAHYDIDTAYLRTMELKLLAGKNFSSNSNTSNEPYVLINEKAMQLLNYKNPSSAIGQQVWLDDSSRAEIIAVVGDFYFRGYDEAVQPLMLRNRADQFRVLTVKLTSTDERVIAGISALWKRVVPGEVFTYEWMLKEKSAIGTISMLGFLAIIAVTLACLGLLGMVTYSIERKRKEIGIRKIMGAPPATIVVLLSKGFMRLVLIAGCIAIPISYILGYFFLNLFANRIDPGIGMQLLSFVGLWLLALISMSTQIYGAAISNPVNALRNE